MQIPDPAYNVLTVHYSKCNHVYMHVFHVAMKKIVLKRFLSVCFYTGCTVLIV